MLPLRRLVLISRPLGYVPMLAVFAAGMAVGPMIFSWKMLAGLLFVTLPMGLIVYGINDIADRESDAANPRKGGMDGAVLTVKETKKLAVVIGITTVIWALIVIITRQYAMLSAILVIYLFAYTYSVEPLRLKTRPILDSLSNGIWITAVFLVGYWSSSAGLYWAWPQPKLLAVVFLFACAYHALGAVMDYEADKQMHDKTIAVALGKTKTLLLIAAIFGLCTAILIDYPIFAGFTAFCMLLTLAGVRYNSSSAIRKIFMAMLALFPAVIAGAMFIYLS